MECAWHSNMGQSQKWNVAKCIDIVNSVPSFCWENKVFWMRSMMLRCQWRIIILFGGWYVPLWMWGGAITFVYLVWRCNVFYWLIDILSLCLAFSLLHTFTQHSRQVQYTRHFSLPNNRKIHDCNHDYFRIIPPSRGSDWHHAWSPEHHSKHHSHPNNMINHIDSKIKVFLAFRNGLFRQTMYNL